MKKLILKYNSRIGKDPFPEIEKITMKLGLKIEETGEAKPGLKRLAVIGNSEKLKELDLALVRYASITRKSA